MILNLINQQNSEKKIFRSLYTLHSTQLFIKFKNIEESSSDPIQPYMLLLMLILRCILILILRWDNLLLLPGSLIKID